jgi:hypothetical protein
VNLDAARLKELARLHPNTTVQPDRHTADRVAIVRGADLDDARRLAERIVR